MTSLAIKWAVLSGVLGIAAAVMPGVKVKSPLSAVAGAAIFGVANVLLGWLLKGVMGFLLFLPSILTLGLVGLLVPIVANMVLLKLADHYTGDEFKIEGISTLFALSTAVSVTSYVAF